MICVFAQLHLPIRSARFGSRRDGRVIGADERIARYRFLQEHYSVGIGSQTAFCHVSHTIDGRCGIAEGEADRCGSSLNRLIDPHLGLKVQTRIINPVQLNRARSCLLHAFNFSRDYQIGSVDKTFDRKAWDWARFCADNPDSEGDSYKREFR